jgi:cytochrome c oxidase subunit 1
VLFGGAIFGIFSGLYYWFPKLTGRMYSEKLGKWHFWLMFLGFNLTFAPMHWLGLQGMVRRTWQYAADMNLGPWNMVVTIGAFTIAGSILIFMWNWVVSKRRGTEAGIDPWDARTLEWTIPSPPPEYNFAEIPTVTSLDDFWHRKYAEDDEERAVRRDDADALVAELERKGNNPEKPIDLPSPSYFPILIGISIMLVGYGIVYNAQAWGLALLLVGVLGAVTSFIGWAQEPGEEEPPGEEH